VYCIWFVPFDDGDNFFAAMIRDHEGDRVIYRFEDSNNKQYFVLTKGDKTIKDFRRRFNSTVEQFCHEANATMEFLFVDGNITQALEIIEKQPWAESILP
jgi:hypothetical protein